MIKNLSDVSVLVKDKTTERGITQLFISKNVKVSTNTISKIFSGSNSKLQIIIRIFDLLDYDIIVSREDEIVNLSKVKDIATEMRKLVAIKNMQIIEISKITNISEVQISNILKGNANIMMENFIKIILALDCKITIQKKQYKYII